MPHWTEAEAGAFLPRLVVLIAALQRAADVTRDARGNGHGVMPATGDADPAAAAEGAITAGEALEELEARGVVLRDVAQGIVDFPSLHPSGQEIELCWRQGEDVLGWWHLPGAGFAARRPLPPPPEL